MKIHSAKTETVSKWVSLSVSHGRKKFRVSVLVKDGIVEKGAGDGVYTSYLKYFNQVPETARQRHFTVIKKYVERYIK